MTSSFSYLFIFFNLQNQSGHRFGGRQKKKKINMEDTVLRVNMGGGLGCSWMRFWKTIKNLLPSKVFLPITYFDIFKKI